MDPSLETKKSGKAKTIFLFIFAVVIIASNTAWSLLYLKEKDGNETASTKVSRLNTENSNLTNQVNQLKQTASQSEQAKDWREIPELGVKYKLTEETKSLTYTYTGPNSIGVSTTQRIDAGAKDPANNRLNCVSQFTVTKTDSKNIKDFESVQSLTPKLIGKYIYTIGRSQNLPCAINQVTESNSAKITGSLLDKLEPIN